MKTVKANWAKHAEYFHKFIKPLQVFGEIIVGFLCMVIPYYCGEIFEGYIMQTNTKGMSDYEIIHLDKLIDFVYALVAIITVELTWLMIKQLIKTLKSVDWNFHKPKIIASLKFPTDHFLWKALKVTLVIVAALAIVVIPYTMAGEYESYVMHLNVAGQSKALISHLSKSIYFIYVLAAAVTIKLIIIFARYVFIDHFGFKTKGNK